MESFIAAMPIVMYGLFGVGLALFIAGIIASFFRWGWGRVPEAATAGSQSIGERIVLAVRSAFTKFFAVFNSADTPRWQRMTSGGLILVLFGLIALLVVLVGPNLVPGGGGGGDAPTSDPTPSS